MKDGRTHLAYKAEHVVDLASEIVLHAEIAPATASDADTMVDSVMAAEANLQATEPNRSIEEVAADKGYHKAQTLELCQYLGMRTYIPEPRRPHPSRWRDKPMAVRRAVENNRRRMRRAKGKKLGRRRSERVERSFAHVCETGGARRTWLRGFEAVTKRYQMVVAAHNLALVMRKLFGTGKPRVLRAFLDLLNQLKLTLQWLDRLFDALDRSAAGRSLIFALRLPTHGKPKTASCSTGC